MKKFLNSKIMMLILIVAMVFSMSSIAFASDSDRNMTDFSGQFTYVVNANEITDIGKDIELMAGPANSNWLFTGFNTEVAANNVTWSVVNGSTSGIAVNSSMALEVETNQYVSYAVVHIDPNVTSGSASIVAKNNATNSAVNFTIVVNPTSPSSAATDVTYEVFAPGAKNPSSTGVGTVSVGDYYSDRNFPTALDAVASMLSNSVINNYKASYGYVSSITVNGQEYAANYATNEGWQYRVYRNNQIVPISEVLGADDFNLQSGDKIVWKYGAYNQSDLF